MQRTLKIFTTFLFVTLCIGISGMAEEIKLTTYYPAPYGAYKEFTTTGNTYLATDDAGNVGIGITDPNYKLDVRINGASAAARIVNNFDPTHSPQVELASMANAVNASMKPGMGALNWAAINVLVSGSYAENHYSGKFVGGKFYVDGNVGIGIPNPDYNLEVASKTKLTQNVGIGGDPDSGINMLKVYGKILTSNGAPLGAGAPANSKGVYEFDIAEDILAEGCEAGDVVIIDAVNNQKVIKSTIPFDTTVAGIISTDPAFHIGKQDKEGYLPLALAGRVICKVSAENGSIERGDLLTTSSIPGHAMKVTDKLKALGAIIGKALEPFEKGPDGEKTGKIVVLVTLQ